MATPIPRPRLGRGLSSLISVGEAPADTAAAPLSDTPASPLADSVISAPVSQIVPNPHQPRQTFDDNSIQELAASIRATGIIQPLLLKRRANGGYELIAGERRLRAAKLAGLETVPAIVRDVEDSIQAQMALIENIQREDLNPIDRAEGYARLIHQLGLTQAELSERLGVERSGIANHLRLLELTESVRAMIRDGRLTLGHGKLLAGVSDILLQQALADKAVAEGLSVRALEACIQNPPATKKPEAKPQSISPHIQDLERSIARQLGMRVQVRSSGKKGRLVIHYTSLDQFDELLGRMNVTLE